MADTIYTARDESTLTVSTMNINTGLHEYRDVRSVTIHSKGYSIMIMADHVPVIGDIDGEIIILLDVEEKRFEGVKGFFQVNSNKMDILITSQEEN